MKHVKRWSKHVKILTIASIFLANPTLSNAWIFVFPLPNLSKPAELERLIDTLEKSNQTKAVAYISEDKTFGSKQWIWAHHTGGETQQATERLALQKCESTLDSMKRKLAGGQPMYDFGNKRCELHEFANPFVSPTIQQDKATQQNPSSPNNERRLNELKSLYEKGLISKEEYETQRKAIIQNL